MLNLSSKSSLNDAPSSHGVVIEGYCCLKGALYSVILENSYNYFVRLFSDGNLVWYKNRNSNNCCGNLNISNIKITSIIRHKTYISFALSDIPGYKHYIIPDTEDTNKWYNSIVNTLQNTLQKYSQICDDEKSYVSEISQIEDFVNEIVEEYLDDELEQKTDDDDDNDFPDWWCNDKKYYLKNLSKYNGRYQWQDDNNEYHFYKKSVSKKFDKLKIGDSMRIYNYINKTFYVLQKISDSEGIQSNFYDNKKRIIRRYEHLNQGFNYIKKYDKNEKLIDNVINEINFNGTGYIIQNEELYLKHKQLEKLWIKNKRCKDINVKYLFYGADYDTINKIASNGFNRIVNTANLYGKGVYFSKNADYCLDYATEDKDGKYRYLLFCRVICGDYSVGSKDQMIPRCKTNSNILEETMVDDINDPSIYVTTMDNQAYPLVLIKIPV